MPIAYKHNAWIIFETLKIGRFEFNTELNFKEFENIVIFNENINWNIFLREEHHWVDWHLS